ncbi:unnamed protein product [Dovyalis caffra]|uniref:Uncharacterized protein n=1 Tax=Dovyalis caffra TaxID=77055 RepID=A0AAV1R933_9ROSI|nr:unnamed protein product [Dovyalis caffra]
MREAGFTEQRQPPAPGSGRITGRCHSGPYGSESNSTSLCGDQAKQCSNGSKVVIDGKLIRSRGLSNVTGFGILAIVSELFRRARSRSLAADLVFNNPRREKSHTGNKDLAFALYSDTPIEKDCRARLRVLVIQVEALSEGQCVRLASQSSDKPSAPDSGRITGRCRSDPYGLMGWSN